MIYHTVTDPEDDYIWEQILAHAAVLGDLRQHRCDQLVLHAVGNRRGGFFVKAQRGAHFPNRDQKIACDRDGQTRAQIHQTLGNGDVAVSADQSVIADAAPNEKSLSFLTIALFFSISALVVTLIIGFSICCVSCSLSYASDERGSM